MSDLAIDICDLSKEYRIGSKQQGYTTLRDMLADSLTAPLRRTVKILRGDALSAAGASEMVWALKDISFSVRHGEVLGLIGRNGAGKSTLLKILSRITEPTSGYADVEGRVGSLLEVGTGFHPELTGRENIYLNGAILGMHRTEIAGKLDEIIAFAEIERYIDTPVKHYSTGMYMRLAFAVAAHLEPDILIVDEVLAVGDASFQKKCLGKMGDVAREGRTILFVSHNMAAIQALCTHGVLLSGGKVEAVGSIGEVIYKYQAALSSVSSLEGIRGVQVLTVRLSTEPQGQLITPDSTVVAEMEFYTERSLPNSYLNLHVDDEEGRHLIHTRTDMFGERPDFQPGLHHVRVRIPRLTLRAGIYSVWFRLYNDSGDATELADSERVMLEVHGPQVGGLIDVPTEWYWTEAEAPVAH